MSRVEKKSFVVQKNVLLLDFHTEEVPKVIFIPHRIDIYLVYSLYKQVNRRIHLSQENHECVHK